MKHKKFEVLMVVKMTMLFFWVVMHLHLLTSLQSVTTQKNNIVIFSSVRTSNLTADLYVEATLHRVCLLGSLRIKRAKLLCSLSFLLRHRDQNCSPLPAIPALYPIGDICL
jgi:hypothetical protein